MVYVINALAASVRDYYEFNNIVKVTADYVYTDMNFIIYGTNIIVCYAVTADGSSNEG